MKILNIDPSGESHFIGDIGNQRNKGTVGRRQNQARYIPSGLVSGTPDPALAIQFVETDAVLKSAASGEIAAFIAQGFVQVVSAGENYEHVLTKTILAPTNSQVFFDDYVFGRPILLTRLIVTPNVPPGASKVVDVIYKKNNTVQISTTAPAAPTVALAAAGAGSVTPGTHSYKVTLVTALGETEAGTVSAIVNVIVASGSAATAALAGAGAGNVDDGTHSWKITFVHAGGETTGSAVSNVLNVVDKTTNGKVALTVIPLGATGTTARKVYRTIAGDTGNYKLVATIADNTTTTYEDNIADGSLGANMPAADDSKVALSVIPTGTSGIVTARKVYRTVAGNTGAHKLLTTISDNITTVYTDNTADGGLGADAPSANTTQSFYRYTQSDSGDKTFDTSAMAYAAAPGTNQLDQDDEMDVLFGLSTDTTGIGSVTVKVYYEFVD